MERSLPHPSPTVVLKELDEGGVLFCTRTEVYFGVNDVGLTVWRALKDGSGPDSSSLGGILDALGTRYPEVPLETLRTDVLDFLDALEESELAVRPSQAENPQG